MNHELWFCLNDYFILKGTKMDNMNKLSFIYVALSQKQVQPKVLLVLLGEIFEHLAQMALY